MGTQQYAPPDREVFRVLNFHGRSRYWERIEEGGGKVLRVILLADKETVQSAFF